MINNIELQIGDKIYSKNEIESNIKYKRFVTRSLVFSNFAHLYEEINAQKGKVRIVTKEDKTLSFILDKKSVNKSLHDRFRSIITH